MNESNVVDGAPDAVVAVYGTEGDLAAAIKHLERESFDMSKISVLGKRYDGGTSYHRL